MYKMWSKWYLYSYICIYTYTCIYIISQGLHGDIFWRFVQETLYSTNFLSYASLILCIFFLAVYFKWLYFNSSPHFCTFNAFNITWYIYLKFHIYILSIYIWRGIKMTVLTSNVIKINFFFLFFYIYIETRFDDKLFRCLNLVQKDIHMKSDSFLTV